MEEEKTVYEIIFEALKESGIDVYTPATKEGECTKEYVVIKNGGGSRIQGYSSKVVYYQFLLYVPQNKYQELERFTNKVIKTIRDNLYPILMPTGSSTPDYFDSEIKAHMRTITYRNNVKGL